jgi:hypothetical protein
MSDNVVFLDVDALGESYNPKLYDVRIGNKIYKVGQRNVILLGITQVMYAEIADAKDKGAEYYLVLREKYIEMTIAILKEFNENVDEKEIYDIGKHSIDKLQGFVHWYNDEFQQSFLESGDGKKKKQEKEEVTQD